MSTAPALLRSSPTHRSVHTRSILFVCTGNTCRSPLAAALCSQMMAEKLGCDISQLPNHAIRIRSAGLMAFPGDKASAPAVEVASEQLLNLHEHRSQPVSAELLSEATDVIVMTRSHLLALKHRFPNLGPTPRLLCGDVDLPDPIGGELDEYRACVSTIKEHLSLFIAEWLEK